MSKKVAINSEWHEMLKGEFEQDYFIRLKQFLKEQKKANKQIYPPGPLIFNAFDKTPFSKVKVVIIGQDPYHNAGEAMGLCFSVPKTCKVPPSLKNIYKELARSTDFDIPSHGDLSLWADQGVFLLNAMLTVEHKKAGSHRKIGWQYFTDAVIKVLSDSKESLVFLLWGNFAKSKKVLIDSNKHLILESVHPSPLAGGKFHGNDHFVTTNKYLKSKNQSIINWQI